MQYDWFMWLFILIGIWLIAYLMRKSVNHTTNIQNCVILSSCNLLNFMMMGKTMNTWDVDQSK